MTMVALLGNPVESASPLTLATPHKLSQMLTESTVTHSTPQLKEIPISNSTAALRDIPTEVPTTAAATDVYDDDDDDRCRTCPSINADNTTPDPTFLQNWDYFTFLKELDALHNEFFPPSTGASIASTHETQTDTITPAGSIVATSDPPAVAEPDTITFLKDLEALDNELTLMRSTRTCLPRTIDATYIPTPVTTSAERNSNETYHDENHHSDHGYANHQHDNNASNNRVNEIRDHADRTTNDSRRDDHQHDDKNKTNATEQAAHNNKTRDNDGSIQPLSPMWHSRQHTSSFPIIGHNQHNRPTDSAPSAMQQCEVAMPKTDNTPEETLAQLWSVLAQLEEVNKQFAQWLNTLTIDKTTTTPDNTPGNQMNPLKAPTATTPTIIQIIPSQHNKHQADTCYETRVNDPTGGRFLLLSPSDRHLPNVRTPPWPPPTSQIKGPNQDLPWNHTQIINLLSIPDARLFRPMPYRHNPIRPSPILNRTPSPSDFMSKHDHKHVRFKTTAPCNPGPMSFWPKEDMRPP